jgi:hypothetical protein
MSEEQAAELKKRIEEFLEEASDEEASIETPIEISALIEEPTPGDVIEIMAQIRESLDTAKRCKAALQKAYDLLTQGFMPEYVDSLGVELITTEDRRLEIRNQMRVNLPAGNRAALHNWLVEHGMDHMVTATVNASTLKAFVKDAIDNQLEFPGELLKIEPYRQAVLVKR